MAISCEKNDIICSHLQDTHRNNEYTLDWALESEKQNGKTFRSAYGRMNTNPLNKAAYTSLNESSRKRSVPLTIWKSTSFSLSKDTRKRAKSSQPTGEDTYYFFTDKGLVPSRRKEILQINRESRQMSQMSISQKNIYKFPRRFMKRCPLLLVTLEINWNQN